jgi:alpha-glucosidase
MVALNLGPGPAGLAVPGPAPAGRVALSTHPHRDGVAVSGPLELRGDEGVVVELG